MNNVSRFTPPTGYSILTPVYNAEKYIAKAITSVLSQTRGDFEYILCDDGSTDKSLEIITSFAVRDPRIRVLTGQTNRGAAMARSTLIAAAGMEYCVFVDADDLIAPDFLEIADYFLKFERFDILEFPFQVNMTGGSRDAVAVPEEEQLIRGDKVLEFFFRGKRNPWLLWGKAVKTQILKKIPRYNFSAPYVDDHLFALPMYCFASSYRSATIKKLYTYNCGNGGWGRNIYPAAEFIRFCDGMREAYLSNRAFLEKYHLHETYARDLYIQSGIPYLHNGILAKHVAPEDTAAARKYFFQTFLPIIREFETPPSTEKIPSGQNG